MSETAPNNEERERVRAAFQQCCTEFIRRLNADMLDLQHEFELELHDVLAREKPVIASQKGR